MIGIKFLRQHLPGIGFVIAVLVAWELGAWFVGWPDPKIIPPPIQVTKKILQDPTLITAGQPDEGNAGIFLMTLTVRTVWRVVKGMVVAVLVAFFVGFLIGKVPLANRLLMPTLTFLAPLSPITWVPIALIMIPEEEVRCVFMVFMSIVFLLSIAIANGVMNVDRSLVSLARSLGAGKGQIIYRVLIPGSLPAIFIGLRMNFFAAWVAVLLAESIGMPQDQWGVGSLVWQARQTMNRELALFSIIILAVVGFLLDQALLLAQNKILLWRKGTTVAF